MVGDECLGRRRICEPMQHEHFVRVFRARPYGWSPNGPRTPPSIRSDSSERTPVLDLLARLVEKSLVLTEDGPNQSKWYRDVQFGPPSVQTPRLAWPSSEIVVTVVVKHFACDNGPSLQRKTPWVAAFSGNLVAHAVRRRRQALVRHTDASGWRML
jgi:hypothetical protein